MKLGKYMEAEPIPGRCDIRNSKTKGLLGRVLWFPSWRQHVFQAERGTIFSADCLAEIQRFLLERNRDEKQEADPCAG